MSPFSILGGIDLVAITNTFRGDVTGPVGLVLSRPLHG